MQHSKNSVVIRSFALPIGTFNYLKKYQKQYQERNNVKLTNSQVLTVLLSVLEEHDDGSWF